eukprot:3941682-Rhodomonas_salina.1
MEFAEPAQLKHALALGPPIASTVALIWILMQNRDPFSDVTHTPTTDNAMHDDIHHIHAVQRSHIVTVKVLYTVTVALWLYLAAGLYKNVKPPKKSPASITLRRKPQYDTGGE